MHHYALLNILFPSGTASNPQEVQSWTPLLVPVYNITSDFVFTVTFELSQLQAHDQEHGRTYNFFIKSCNRAGLATTAESPEYLVSSKILPTVGRIYHISENNSEEISFQTQDDVLCVYWTGFTHHDDQLNMSLSIGSYPGGNNILHSISVSSHGEQCFHGLVLPHLQQSFVNILAFNEKGSVNASSKGIFIASEEEILYLAKVNDGPDCAAEFTELDTDVKLGNSEPNTKNFSVSTLPSVTYVTLSVQYEWSGDFRPLVVQTLGKTANHYSWMFQQNYVQEYFKLPISETDQLMTISSPVNITLSMVAFSPCLMDQGIQTSATQLKSTWTFRPEVQPFVSHAKVIVQEYRCASQDCAMENSQFLKESTSKMEYIRNAQLASGNSYRTSIRPCFRSTCISAVQSAGITVIANPPLSGMMECVMKPSLVNGSVSTPAGNVYTVDASWEPFQHTEYGFRLPNISVYDWTLATSTGSYLMAWERKFLKEAETMLEVRKNVSVTEIFVFLLAMILAISYFRNTQYLHSLYL